MAGGGRGGALCFLFHSGLTLAASFILRSETQWRQTDNDRVGSSSKEASDDSSLDEDADRVDNSSLDEDTDRVARVPPKRRAPARSPRTAPRLDFLHMVGMLMGLDTYAVSAFSIRSAAAAGRTGPRHPRANAP